MSLITSISSWITENNEEEEYTPVIKEEMDVISDILKETTIIPRKKRQKTRKTFNIASVLTMHALTDTQLVSELSG